MASRSFCRSAVAASAAARESVGRNGDGCIDIHQRFDVAGMIHPHTPPSVEEPIPASSSTCRN